MGYRSYLLYLPDEATGCSYWEKGIPQNFGEIFDNESLPSIVIGGGGAGCLRGRVDRLIGTWGGVYKNISVNGTVRGNAIVYRQPQRCTNDSCGIVCASSPYGFCCIDHSVTNRLLQVLTT